MAESPVVTIDGVQYAPMSTEWYESLLAELEKNQHARYVAVEEFRLWCQANKGVDTVEEGLRACTTEELMAAVYRETPVWGWSQLTNLIYPLVHRLDARTKRAERERQDAAQTPIPLEEV